MSPMSSFDPDQPSQVHDAVSDQVLNWPAGWAHMWREYAFLDESEGTVYFFGLIFDGWEPVASSSKRQTG